MFLLIICVIVILGIILLLGNLAYLQILLWRNEAVAVYRKMALGKILAASMRYLYDNGVDNYLLLKEKSDKAYESVSYDEMYREFWKPLDSFWSEEQKSDMVYGLKW